MKLRDIQESFKDTMIDPALLDQKDGAFRDLFGKEGLALENRMKVYRNNVVRGLSDAVIAAYPVTKKLTGNDFITAATRSYVIKNFPKQGNLNLYGGTFADFLETYEPAKALPYLPDVARMEWAWEEAYYAKDDTALNPATLQTLPEDKLPFVRLVFRDSVHFVSSPYPLDKIYDFCKEDNTEASEFAFSQKGAKLLIFRPEYTVEARRLDDAEYAFLKALSKGHTIMEATTRTLTTEENFNLTACLQKFLTLGIFKEEKI